LILNIKTKIRIDAGNQIHCLLTSTSPLLAYPISVPKLGTLVGRPKPKNVSVVSIPIFAAKFIVKLVMINELRFGMISRNMMTKSLVPRVFDALTSIFSLVLLVAVLLFVFIGSAVIDQSQVMRVSILDKYAVPGAISPNGGTYLLGADEGGRDVWGQLIIGARNSILIGFSITIITSIVGVGLGIISGYYGGIIDNILMRIVDFVMILPIMLIIIVIVSIVPRYNVWTFIWVMSAFYWVGKARLFRSKTLSEGRRDYVSASKTQVGCSLVLVLFLSFQTHLSPPITGF